MRVPKRVSRREFMRLAGMAAGAAGLALSTIGRAADPLAKGGETDAVLVKLLDGNKRFMKGDLLTRAGSQRTLCHLRRVRPPSPLSSAVRTRGWRPS